jgi:hypothetical protein
MQVHDSPPPRILLFLFGIMGTGILLPWNTFISGADYFEELYPCSHIEFKFAIAYMASLMIFMFLCVVLGHLLGLGTRVVAGYVLLLLSMLGSLPVRTQAAHILMVILTGIGDALVQGSMYGVAGSFPPLFMRALMMGTAVAGVIVSVIRIFSKVNMAKYFGQSVSYFVVKFANAFHTFCSACILWKSEWRVLYIYRAVLRHCCCVHRGLVPA